MSLTAVPLDRGTLPHRHRYSAVQIAMCALPSIGFMLAGANFLAGASPQARLMCVWGGLVSVMVLRALTIWAPYKLRTHPFKQLWEDKGKAASP